MYFGRAWSHCQRISGWVTDDKEIKNEDDILLSESDEQNKRTRSLFLDASNRKRECRAYIIDICSCTDQVENQLWSELIDCLLGIGIQVNSLVGGETQKDLQ
jgi:hypothetical protein